MLKLILYSAIVGILGGGCIGAGAARMYHAPEKKALGAFRTLGELGACGGDAKKHALFGLGHFITSLDSAAVSGVLTQDVFHRIIPNWGAVLGTGKKSKVEEVLQSPGRMMFAGALIGGVTVVLFNAAFYVMPERFSVVAAEILLTAMGLLIRYVMPAVFWLAAMDAGKTTGICATILGGISFLVFENALPGIVLGVLIGKALEERKSRG